MGRPRAADDFPAIRARLEELQRERSGQPAPDDRHAPDRLRPNAAGSDGYRADHPDCCRSCPGLCSGCGPHSSDRCRQRGCPECPLSVVPPPRGRLAVNSPKLPLTPPIDVGNPAVHSVVVPVTIPLLMDAIAL